MFGKESVEVCNQQLANEIALTNDPFLRGNENQFARFERIGDGNGNAVGIDAVGFTIVIESEWWYDWNDFLIKQCLQKLDIDALNFSGKEMIHVLDDAYGMRDDNID